MRGTRAFSLSGYWAEGGAHNQSGHSLSIISELRVFAIPTNQVCSNLCEETVKKL